MIDMNTWKPIEGYKYPYRINRKGVVQKRKKDGKWHPLSIHKDAKGYNRVCLKMVEGRQQRRMVSTLLYEHFGPNAEGANRPREVPVEMIDKDGRVLKEYPSLAAAAFDNHFTVASVYQRCKGNIKHPFKHYDVSFRYKELDT